jgi:hypothetical protein
MATKLNYKVDGFLINCCSPEAANLYSIPWLTHRSRNTYRTRSYLIRQVRTILGYRVSVRIQGECKGIWAQR